MVRLATAPEPIGEPLRAFLAQIDRFGILANHATGLNVHDAPALKDVASASIALSRDGLHGDNVPGRALGFSAFRRFASS